MRDSRTLSSSYFGGGPTSDDFFVAVFNHQCCLRIGYQTGTLEVTLNLLLARDTANSEWQLSSWIGECWFKEQVWNDWPPLKVLSRLITANKLKSATVDCSEPLQANMRVHAQRTVSVHLGTAGSYRRQGWSSPITEPSDRSPTISSHVWLSGNSFLWVSCGLSSLQSENHKRAIVDPFIIPGESKHLIGRLPWAGDVDSKPWAWNDDWKATIQCFDGKVANG
jgi:hypothetical protein